MYKKLNKSSRLSNLPDKCPAIRKLPFSSFVSKNEIDEIAFISMSPESALLSIRDEPIEHKGGSLSS